MVAQDILAQAKEALDRSDLDAALDLAEAGLKDADRQIEAISVMAAVAFRQDDWARALLLLERIVDHPGAPAEVEEAVAVLNCIVGRLSEALFHGKAATTKTEDGRLMPLFGPEFPKFSDAFSNISERPLLRRAKAALRAGSAKAARFLVEQHLTITPTDVEALDFLAALLEEMGDYEEAIGVLRSVQTLGGQSATLLSRLAKCLMATGDRDSALACHDLAMARAPGSIAIHAAALEAWNAHPFMRGPRHLACLDSWKKLIQAKIPKVVRPLPPAAEGGRKVVGFLCTNVEDETTRAMIGRIAGRVDRNRFTVIGFGSGDLADNSNLLYRNAFQRYRSVSQLDELTLAALVRGEGVDILIDCDGLSAPAHHGLYVRNAARVQLSWLNMPQGEILLGGHATLAGSALATGPYLLSADNGIAKTVPASLNEGTVTFGADISVADFNADVALAWSLVLQKCPNAILALRDDGQFSKPDMTTHLVNMFGNFGVAHRIDIISGTKTEFWSQVDVALASFPSMPVFTYGEALAAGIPVIVLDQGRAGDFAVAVRSVGEGDTMVAADLATYVDLSAGWGSDLARLVAHRQDAPSRLAGKATYSLDGYVKGLEDHLLGLLAEQPARV